MASSVTTLRRPSQDGPDDCHALLARVRERVGRMALQEGAVATPCRGICVYRFDHPTTFRKAAAFGVTLGVVLSGDKRVRFGDQDLHVGPARMLVVTRETAHESAVLHASPTEPYLGVSLCFAPERVAHALLALSEAGGAGHGDDRLPAFVMDQDARVLDAIDRLLLTLDDPLEYKLVAPLIVDEILFRLLRSEAAAAVRAGVGQAADSQRILESMRFIREHHTQKLSVTQLARQVAMSPSHYAHRFSAIARMSPMRYAREVRLQQARTLLLDRSTRANEVAMQVGFESAAHFTREFKRRFGTPPSLYRAQT